MQRRRKRKGGEMKRINEMNNAELLAHYADFVALGGPFAIEAISRYAEQVVNNASAVREAMEDSFIAPAAWINAAERWMELCNARLNSTKAECCEDMVATRYTDIEEKLAAAERRLRHYESVFRHITSDIERNGPNAFAEDEEN